MAKKVNQETGEVIVYREPSGMPSVPADLESIPTASQVAGKNPLGVNLRDHPEYNGQNFVCMRARIATGESGEFIIATGFVFPDGVKPSEDHAVTLITGADNVYSRIIAAMDQGVMPMRGRLRKAGRAWFLD